MPPKGELKEVYFGTADGQVLGKLDTISSVELSANEVTDVPTFSQIGFTGSLKLEANNERKMHGKPLRRGRKGIYTLLRKALKPHKRRNRREYGRN